MYVSKCTFTLILFTLIFNINAENSGKISDTNSTLPSSTQKPDPIIPATKSVNDTTTPITIPVTLTTVVDSTTEPITTPSTVPPAPTTQASTTTGPVTTPNVTTASPNTTESPHHSRQFDGPSFIGGIVLATGLMAIGFVAFKFYKARTERNYHTL